MEGLKNKNKLGTEEVVQWESTHLCRMYWALGLIFRTYAKKSIKGNVSDQIPKTAIHFEYKIFHHLERCDLCSVYESFIGIHVRASCACLLPDRGQKMAPDPRKLKLQYVVSHRVGARNKCWLNRSSPLFYHL